MKDFFIISILIFCMSAGIISGPYLWTHSKQETQILAKEEVTEKKQETKDVNPLEIRVLISNQTLGKYTHKKVKITSDQDYYMKSDAQTVKKKAGTVTTLSYQKKKKGQTVVFSGTGSIQISSIKRGYGTPSYRGKIEIHYGSSGMTVINELLLEEYLYAVIPSEMPVSYGQEALKVQAVCARSFAVKQMQGTKFKSYGADVDDSVASQVYNNTKECKESIQASLDTAGLVATYQNKVISTYFFSTSWGHTADSHDVFLQSGSSPVYLRGKSQTDDEKVLDLSTEQALKKFLDEEPETYDSEFPWYRWSVKIPLSALDTKTTGSIQNIKVTSRGKSGVAKEIRITGKKGVKVIQGEYRIRTYLSPKGCAITKKDGTKGSMELLPSGCFYLEQKKNELIIHGGGYGHGTGMSQNGVRYQTKQGRTYEEILKFYYEGIEIKDLSECE
jgi:stage II sporulation protein D